MRALVFGDVLLSSLLKIKYNSVNSFSLKFWDDSSKTVPSDLTGASITIVVDVNGTPLTWTAANSGNTATWNLTEADTLVAWRSNRYKVVFTKSGQKKTVLSGDVRIQV